MAGYPKLDQNTGTYYFVLEAGKDAFGKRKRVKRSGFKKRSEAKVAMAEMLLELKNGNSLNGEKISLGNYLDYWLKNYVKIKLKPKTFAEYEKIIKSHLQPSLGHIMLDKLRSIQLQNYYSVKLENLSAQSVTHHHSVLSKALNDAIGWEFITKNVAKGAIPPTPQKRKRSTLDVEQLNLLLETARQKTPVFFPVIYTAGHTGMRKSELIGLNWNNVDFLSQRVYVRQTITEANGKYHINQSPKNGKARGVKLTAENMKLLQELYALNNERKQILGNTYNPLDLVFCNSVGNIMAHSELTRALKRALKATELPDIRFHDLRHTHATILLKAGVHPKIVSERLGHSKIGITMDLYSEVTPSIEEQAIIVLDKLLN